MLNAIGLPCVPVENTGIHSRIVPWRTLRDSIGMRRPAWKLAPLLQALTFTIVRGLSLEHMAEALHLEAPTVQAAAEAWHKLFPEVKLCRAGSQRGISHVHSRLRASPRPRAASPPMWRGWSSHAWSQHTACSIESVA